MEANIRVSATARPRWSVPKGNGANRSTAPVLASGQAGWRGLGHVLVADPQDEAAGVHLGVALGPHAAQRAAQAGGELGAPIHHVPDGHAVGEVEVGPPAGAVAVDRRDEPDGLGVSGQGLVDPGQAQHAQGPDHHLAGEAGRPRDDHGPLEQRPIRWRPGHAQGGDQQGHGGPADGRRSDQQRDRGQHHRDRQQHSEGGPPADPPIALAGQLQVGLGVLGPHCGLADWLAFQVQQPPQPAAQQAGGAAGGPGGQPAGVGRGPGQVVGAGVGGKSGRPPAHLGELVPRA